MQRTLKRKLIHFGALFAGIGVILGAFGAHLLKNHISTESLASFETGIRYQMIHALAMLIVAALNRRLHENVVQNILIFFTVGIILFSGSIYVLATKSLWIDSSLRWISFITPLGGISFISGWYLLAFKAYKSHHSGHPEDAE